MRKIFFLTFCLIFSIHAKVYDCFLFYNEFEMLKCRIHELNDVVDYFVLVESEETFQGNAKPLYFKENKHLFSEYLDKIIYVPLEKQQVSLENTPIRSPWDRENFQRQQIIRGVCHASSKDLILLSDVDEIPRKTVVQDLLLWFCRPENIFTNKTFLLMQYGANFFINRTYGNNAWPGTIISCKETYIQRSFCGMRLHREGFEKVENGGWHFSSLGGLQAWITKLESFSHNEANIPDYKTYLHWELEKNNRKLVPIDETFPSYIRENQVRLIQEGYIEPW